MFAMIDLEKFKIKVKKKYVRITLAEFFQIPIIALEKRFHLNGFEGSNEIRRIRIRVISIFTFFLTFVSFRRMLMLGVCSQSLKQTGSR